MDEREPVTEVEPPKAKVFEPVDYYRLKATLLEIAVQEGQLREQAVALQQRKVALFAQVGLPVAAYQFNDQTFAVERVG